jgi:hypothetical protein
MREKGENPVSGNRRTTPEEPPNFAQGRSAR